MSYHTLIFAGRLGRDPELRYTPDGKAVTDFSVAVDDGWGENKKTIWFRVTVWDKQAESCSTYLKKGSQVLIEGRLKPDKATGSPRIWNRQDGSPATSFEVTATIVRFLSSRASGGETSGDFANDNYDEEIPF